MNSSKHGKEFSNLIEGLCDCTSDVKVVSTLKLFFASRLELVPPKPSWYWSCYADDIVGYLVPETITPKDQIQPREWDDPKLETTVVIPFVIYSIMSKLERDDQGTARQRFAVRVNAIIENPMEPSRPSLGSDSFGIPDCFLYRQELVHRKSSLSEGVAENILISSILTMQKYLFLSEPSKKELGTMDVPSLLTLADDLVRQVIDIERSRL